MKELRQERAPAHERQGVLNANASNNHLGREVSLLRHLGVRVLAALDEYVPKKAEPQCGCDNHQDGIVAGWKSLQVSDGLIVRETCPKLGFDNDDLPPICVTPDEVRNRS